MFSLESDQMTIIWPSDSQTFTVYVTFSNSIPNWATFVKEVFYAMFISESDEMTALWPGDSLTFTLYVTFSNSITNWTTFVKEVFWLNVHFRKWPNDCLVAKW